MIFHKLWHFTRRYLPVVWETFKTELETSVVWELLNMVFFGIVCLILMGIWIAGLVLVTTVDEGEGLGIIAPLVYIFGSFLLVWILDIARNTIRKSRDNYNLKYKSKNDE